MNSSPHYWLNVKLCNLLMRSYFCKFPVYWGACPNCWYFVASGVSECPGYNRCPEFRGASRFPRTITSFEYFFVFRTGCRFHYSNTSVFNDTSGGGKHRALAMVTLSTQWNPTSTHPFSLSGLLTMWLHTKEGLLEERFAVGCKVVSLSIQRIFLGPSAVYIPHLAICTLRNCLSLYTHHPIH